MSENTNFVEILKENLSSATEPLTQEIVSVKEKAEILEKQQHELSMQLPKIKDMLSSMQEDYNATLNKKDLTKEDILAVKQSYLHKYATEFCAKITDLKDKYTLGSYVKARAESEIKDDKHLFQALKSYSNTSLKNNINKSELSINPLEYEFSPSFELTPLEIKSSSYAEIFQDMPLVEIGVKSEEIVLPSETQAVNAAILPFEKRDRLTDYFKNVGKFKKNTVTSSAIVNGFEYSETLMGAASSYYAGFIMRQAKKVQMANLEIFASGLFDGVYGKAFDMNVDVEASSKWQHILPIVPKINNGKVLVDNGNYVYTMDSNAKSIGSIDALAKRDALKPLITNRFNKFYVNSGAVGTISAEDLIKFCRLAPMALGEMRNTVKMYMNELTLIEIEKLLLEYGKNNFNNSFFNYSEVRGVYTICGIEVRTTPEMPVMATGNPAILIANLSAYFTPYRFYGALKEGNPGNPDFDTLRGIMKLDVFGSTVVDPTKAISVLIG